MGSHDVTAGLYPELGAGGLKEALAMELAVLGLDVAVSTPGSRYWASVNVGERSGQISCGAEERLFTVDLWFEGVMMIGGSTPELAPVAALFARWLEDPPPVRHLLAEFSFASA